MGLFDRIHCHAPLPIPDGAVITDLPFQTKDLPCLMDTYEIRADGTIWVEEYDTEDRSELGAWLRTNPGKTSHEAPEELQGFAGVAGCMTRVNKRWVACDMTNTIHFYTSLGKQLTGWIEYKAIFVKGKLLEPIGLVEYRPVDPTEEERRKVKTEAFWAEITEQEPTFEVVQPPNPPETQSQEGIVATWPPGVTVTAKEDPK